MAAITVSREYGSNGAVIARLLADRLGYHLLDRDLVDAVAERAGVSTAAARCVDERPFGGANGFFYSLLLALQGQQLTPECYRYLAIRIIREAVRREDVVVLGRAGQIVLAARPDVFHVHVVAPLDDRIAEIARREGISREQARKRIREVEECRRQYVWSVGQRDWADPALYDLVVNTHRLPPEAAADLIVDGARRVGVVAARNGIRQAARHVGEAPLSRKWLVYTSQ